MPVCLKCGWELVIGPRGCGCPREPSPRELELERERQKALEEILTRALSEEENKQIQELAEKLGASKSGDSDDGKGEA